MTCDICCGSGHIRLPVYRPLCATRYSLSDTATEKLSNSVRSYPCPECSNVPNTERVSVLGVNVTATSYGLERDEMNFVRHHVARAIADKLVDSDQFVKIEKSQPDDIGCIKVSATVGVVNLSVVETIDQRATDKAKKMLRGAMSRAIRQINIWGRDLGRQTIEKNKAIEYIQTEMEKFE